MWLHNSSTGLRGVAVQEVKQWPGLRCRTLRMHERVSQKNPGLQNKSLRKPLKKKKIPWLPWAFILKYQYKVLFVCVFCYICMQECVWMYSIDVCVCGCSQFSHTHTRWGFSARITHTSSSSSSTHTQPVTHSCSYLIQYQQCHQPIRRSEVSFCCSEAGNWRRLLEADHQSMEETKKINK